MNYFSNEQCEILNNHIKFMMNTNRFDFVIYFIKQYEVSKENIGWLSSYSFNVYKHNGYNNFVKFSTYKQLMTYINKFFDSPADFFNKFFVFNEKIDNADELKENVFIKSIQYWKETFDENTFAYNFNSNLSEIISSHKNVQFFNFAFKYNDIDETYRLSELLYGNENPSNIMFYYSDLSDNEKEYFEAQYKYHNMFNSASKAQIETHTSNALVNYRYGLDDFDQVYNNIKKYESCINNYFLPKINEFTILKYGENNKYINALKECMTKLVKNFESKKIQFVTLNEDPKEQFKLSFDAQSLKYADGIKNIIYKTMPDKTPLMLSTYFSCKVNFIFGEPLSMQVKNSFLKKLNNYLINNNIKPETIKLIDENKTTKPATGVYMTFICNVFDNIGVNPIKFMIPKLGMKKF